MRIDRMLAIVVLLLNKQRISARELAGRFEVSIRTVYRDIDAINLAGIPIVSYSGNSGGFGIMDNYKLDRQLLSLNDMKSILTALKGINTTLEDQYLTSAIDKITTLVPKDKTEELNRHCSNVIIDILPWAYNESQRQIIKSLNIAIKESILASFDYKNLRGERQRRTVEPMSLVFKGYSWYLFGYCRMREDYRMFRITRMKDLSVSNDKFERKDFSYFDISQGGNESKTSIDIKIKFSSEIKDNIEERFDNDGIEYLEDGSMIVSMKMPEDHWVYSYILSFGEYAEVLEPVHLRDIIRDKARKIEGIY
jgi:predicted DNA-binding transcriptional regulator YafY